MLDVFLEKLEVENAELLYVQYPSMVEAAGQQPESSRQAWICAKMIPQHIAD